MFAKTVERKSVVNFNSFVFIIINHWLRKSAVNHYEMIA